MTATGVVHWHEGLFLQPHHLQLMQQGMIDRIADGQLLTRPFPYGVVACEISVDAIHNRRLEFQRLEVVFRSGRYCRVPEDTLLPPLDLGPLMDGGPDTITVSIGLPYWSPQRGNVVNGTVADALYRSEERELLDDATGTNPQPVQLRVPNLRLLVNDNGRSGCETLPIMKIRRGVGDQIGKPVVDRAFVPASLVLEGSAELRRQLQAMVDQIEASRRDLVTQLVQGEFSPENLRPVQIVPLMKLRTLNRYSALLSALIHSPGATPFQWYLLLRELLGELVALVPSQDTLLDCPDYHHEDAGPVFEDLCARIRSQLINVARKAVLRVAFAEQEGLVVATLTDEHMTRPNEYFLGIQTTGDPTALSHLVEDPDKFKLMARSRVLRAVRGLRLVEERQPPIDLPRQAGLYFFKVDRASEQSIRAWADVTADPDKMIAVKRPPGAFPDASYTLFMTIPD